MAQGLRFPPGADQDHCTAYWTGFDAGVEATTSWPALLYPMCFGAFTTSTIDLAFWLSCGLPPSPWTVLTLGVATVVTLIWANAKLR